MDFDSFRVLVKKVLYEDQHGPLPGNQDAKTSSTFVATELEKLGFIYDYMCQPADQNTCFPIVIVYTRTHRNLAIERAIQLLHDSKPRHVLHESGVITAWYGREPIDPNNHEHYKFFLDVRRNSAQSRSDAGPEIVRKW